MIAYSLGFFAIGGFGNAMVIPQIVPHGIAPEMLRAPPVTAATLLTVAATVYGATALAAATRLWRMKQSAPWVFLAWELATMVYCGLFALLVRLPPDSPPGLGAGLLVLVAMLLVAGWIYVRRVFSQER